MTWTLDKATNDIIAFLEACESHDLYIYKGSAYAVKKVVIINMSEDKQFYIFKVKLILEHPTNVNGEMKSEIIISKKYTKEMSKVVADWDDDD